MPGDYAAFHGRTKRDPEEKLMRLWNLKTQICSNGVCHVFIKSFLFGIFELGGWLVWIVFCGGVTGIVYLVKYRETESKELKIALSWTILATALLALEVADYFLTPFEFSTWMKLILAIVSVGLRIWTLLGLNSPEDLMPLLWLFTSFLPPMALIIEISSNQNEDWVVTLESAFLIVSNILWLAEMKLYSAKKKWVRLTLNIWWIILSTIALVVEVESTTPINPWWFIGGTIATLLLFHLEVAVESQNRFRWPPKIWFSPKRVDKNA